MHRCTLNEVSSLRQIEMTRNDTELIPVGLTDGSHQLTNAVHRSLFPLFLQPFDAGFDLICPGIVGLFGNGLHDLYEFVVFRTGQKAISNNEQESVPVLA